MRSTTSRAKQLLKRSALLALLMTSLRQAYDIIRTRLRHARWRRSRQPVIREYLEQHASRNLQLGCGPTVLPGWLNADWRPRKAGQIFLNVVEPFPFEAETFDRIMAEHLIQDLTYAQTEVMLRECHRVLRKGGRLRLATPDLEQLMKLFSPEKTAAEERYVRWAVENYCLWADVALEGLVINNLFQEHVFFYDTATLSHLLTKVGFEGIVKFRAGDSSDPVLKGLDSHGRVLGDEEINLWETLTLEAIRP